MSIKKVSKYPKISIVIPSYNKIKYIGQTLKSIVDQKYPNVEVIIQDGGSRDGTVEIIKKYAVKYPGIITWESKKDNGQLDAINKGLKKSCGDILTFINADDVYEKNALSIIANSYQDNPDALWYAGRGRVIDQIGKETAKVVTLYKNILLSLNSYNMLLVTNYLMQPSVFMSKDAYKKFGPFTGAKSFVTEYVFWLKIGRIKMPVLIDQLLSSFRLSKGSISTKSSVELLKADYSVVKKFTGNILILGLHQIHNYSRLVVNRLLNYG